MKLKQIITIIEREDEMISYEVRPLNVLIHVYSVLRSIIVVYYYLVG